MLATSVMNAMLGSHYAGLGLVAVCDEQHVVSVFTDTTCAAGAGERRRAHRAGSEIHDAQRLLRSSAKARAIDAKARGAKLPPRQWSMKTANSPA